MSVPLPLLLSRAFSLKFAVAVGKKVFLRKSSWFSPAPPFSRLELQAARGLTASRMKQQWNRDIVVAAVVATALGLAIMHKRVLTKPGEYWQSPVLSVCGVKTDFAFEALVHSTKRLLLAFPSEFQRPGPHVKGTMRSTAQGGAFVKADTALRLIKTAPPTDRKTSAEEKLELMTAYLSEALEVPLSRTGVEV